MKHLANNLVDRFHTRDPFEIAERLGFIVGFEPLGEIAALYNSAYGRKFIHINSDLPKYRYAHLAAVCLYHAIRNDDYGIVYRKKPKDLHKPEMQHNADRFAYALQDTRNKLLSFKCMKDAVKEWGMTEQEEAGFNKWVDSLLSEMNVRIPKITKCDRINKILYIMDAWKE